MPRVVVAGSENETSFAVIDFTTPASATTVLVDPQFNAGCRVAISGSHTAVGSVLTGQVRVVDVTDPATPVPQGTAMTLLNGIGAIAMRDSLVAAGEFSSTFQARVTLMDFSNPNAPVILGTAATPLISQGGRPAISSLAFTSDHVVVVSGSDPEIVQIDFTNPNSPSVTSFTPGLAGPPVIDASAAIIAAGDASSGIVKWFDAGSHTSLGRINTQLLSVDSIAVTGQQPILAASQNDTYVHRINTIGTASDSRFDPNLGGGPVVAVEATTGVCGAVLGSAVKLIDLTGTPTVLGTADPGLASISTLGISSFTAPAGPRASWSPLMLAFGPVLVGTPKTLPLALRNVGGSTLGISNLRSDDPQVTFSPSGPFTLSATASQTVNVTFTPTAAASLAGKNLRFDTTDPTNASAAVSLTGSGDYPHITVTPQNLNFPGVPVCLSTLLPVNVHNSGAVPLTVTAAQTTTAAFSATPATLTVGPGATSTLTVRFRPTTVGTASDTLTITSNDPNTGDVRVGLTGTGLPTPPPAIAVAPTDLQFGDFPVQFFFGLSITVANTSPCQPLTVALTSNGAPFFVTDTDPTTLPPDSLTVSGTVLGNSSKHFVVVFAPQSAGPVTGLLTIASNDPSMPTTTVRLQGNGVLPDPVSVELVLDRSGSMSAPGQGGTKIENLKSAVKLFADLVITGRGDEMGSVEFDDEFAVLTPFRGFDDAQRAAVENGANALTPRNFTSIGGGLRLGQAQLSPATNPRQVLLVFTDGLENRPPSIAAAQPAITQAGTEVYAIGLGQPQNISVAALSELASSSNGTFFLTNDTLVLRKHFLQVLADAFRHQTAADPLITVTQGGDVEIPVAITTCERRITFVLNWDNPSSVVDFTVTAPDNTRFTPNSPLSNQLVRYGERPGYRFYQIAFPPLGPGAGATIGPPQLGTWRMRIHGASLAGAEERCSTSVLVESQLTMRGTVQALDTTTPIRLEARIQEDAQRITDAEVVVTVTAPQTSLAAASTPAIVAQALNADRQPIPTGLPPLIALTTRRYRLTPGHQGVFSLDIPAPEVDGVYSFEFQARGTACGGTFQRYQSMSLYISGKPHAGTTTVDISHEKPGTAILRVTPRDASGNPLGPGISHLIDATADHGAVHPLMDLHDGSYAAQLSWRHDHTPPIVRLTMGTEDITVTLDEPETQKPPHPHDGS
ncbi:choice-of-anchor D domain-containing protein [Streptomyces mayteni]